jgi:hypothetical protein
MYMISNGEGGAGKYWLVRHIVKEVHTAWGDLQTSVRSSKCVLLMVHHRMAVFSIKGRTIYSALGASCADFNRPYISLQGSRASLKTLQSLQDIYKDVRLVVVDEYSVNSCAIFQWMDQQMREIWPITNTLRLVAEM